MNRRSFLQTTGLAAGSAALLPSVLTKRAEAATQTTSGTNSNGTNPKSGKNGRAPLSTTLDPWQPAAGEWNVTTAAHLYRRAGFGATYAEITAAIASTPSAVIAALLDDSVIAAKNLPQPPDYSSNWLNVPPYVGTNQGQQQQQQIDYAYAMMALRTWWTSQMAMPASTSGAQVQLRERMVAFWTNHFVVEESTVYYPQLMYDWITYFRQNPWGNFKQMVKDVTIMPAMLIYLGGNLNVRGGANENYAREVMELFTMGITDQNGNANYTQYDITQIAKALTGWGIDYTSTSPVLATTYNVNLHDSTVKNPFNSTEGNPNNTAQPAPYGVYSALSSSYVSAGEDIIDLMFAQRGNDIAYFICSKLYQTFIYNDITTTDAQGIISAMAQTFLANNFELKPVLSQLLNSECFFDANILGACLKSPYDHMIGSLRSLNIFPTPLQTSSLFDLGYLESQELLDAPNVAGWPGYHSWISTTSLPYRNSVFSAALINSPVGIPGTGSDGYGNNYLPIQLSDAEITTWAKQFPNYSAQYTDFVNDVLTFMAAVQPGAGTIANRITSKAPPNYYEWPTLSDADKLSTLRTILYQVMLLANFQLM